MAEYEVESVTEARVAKKSKKAIWEYNVKWKGYSSDENTWEPVASFAGSEEILAKFWGRVDVGGRDITNMTLFQIGDTFVPTGPPRRKPTRTKSSRPEAVVSPSVSAGPSKEPTRSSKRRRSSPPAVDLYEKPAKRMRGRVSETTTRPPEEVRESHPQPVRRPEAGQAQSSASARSIRRVRKRTPSPDIVPPSEDDEEDDAMVVDILNPKAPSQAAQSPLQEQPEIHDLSLEDDLPCEKPPNQLHTETSPDPIALTGSPRRNAAKNDASSSSALPSHRARVAKPLVKVVDDFAPMDGAISVKARLQGRSGSSGEVPIAGPSTSPARKSSRKPGPGRSSAGMINKTTSSLLTFENGALKTVKGKFAAPGEQNSALGSSGMLDDPIPDVPMSESPVAFPTSDELLKLSGFDSTAADALDDFEEDVPVPAEAPEPSNNSRLQSLTAAKNNLFPPEASGPTTTTPRFERPTIFGVLFVPLSFVRWTFLKLGFRRGSGSAVVHATPSTSKPFFLGLDNNIAVPLDLTNVTQSFDTIIGDKPNGPPGKFFLDTNAHKLLDTIRTSGPSARVVIQDSATEAQKAHFQRFRSRLDQGELFTAMVGSVFLAFCSSETPLMQRLNLTPTLASLSKSVFVSQVVIENYTAYAEVAETADKSRW
ncbi:hypothetical protein B0H10DRAFT_2431358 [Mycena sp. CBHHK59/15]|nr:hypothetical protein B0H10DRAFT_2431358 [Mycena sp. CBHHK59/15]